MITFALFVVGLALAFRLGQMTKIDEATALAREASRVLDEAVARNEKVVAMLEEEQRNRTEVESMIKGLERIMGGQLR